MKANLLHAFGSADALRWEDVADPIAGPGEVLIRITAAGVNLGDTIIRSGKAFDLPLPAVLGSEAAGVVEALGPGVSGLKIGQRILAAPYLLGLAGGYATHIVVAQAAVFPLPDAVCDEVANALAIAGITAQGLARLLPVAGKSVVVHAAAGGVGNILLQLLVAAGAKVTATIGSPEKAAALEGLGADAIVPVKDWTARVKDPDVIFDAIGGTVAAEGLDLLAPAGTFVSYGAASGTYPALAPDKTPAFTMKAQSYLGFSLMPVLSRPDGPARIGEALAELFALVETGQLRPLIGHRLPLSQAAEAHRLIESRSSVGKIVLVA